MNWYVVYTRANCESKASDNLRKQDFAQYFPHHCEWRGKGKATSHLKRIPVFMRYLFVETERTRVHEVNETRGVERVLCVDGEPCEIPGEVIAELRTRLGPGGKVYGHMPPKEKFAGVPDQFFYLNEADPLFGFLASITRVIDNERIIAKLHSALFGAAGREIEVPTSHVGELLPVTN